MQMMNIRTMKEMAELNWAIELAAQEGWNPGLYDADPFWQMDPQGFWIGLIDQKPIACISAVKYPNQFAFVGFYIVVPEYRSQGYGWQIWQTAMQSVAGYTVGLDGVFEQQKNYQRSGFVFAHRNIRFAYSHSGSIPFPNHLVPLSAISMEKLLAYDAQCFPAPRKPFWEAWRRMPNVRGWALCKNEQLQGIGLIRQCRDGYKIGPLFADNVACAQTLFQGLCSTISEETTIYWDVPEIHADAMALAAEYKMKEVFGTARMYVGERPALDDHKIFGVTTFELG